MIGKPAAFDLMVVSLLNSNTLNEAGDTGGSAARKALARKYFLFWSIITVALK